MRIVAFALGLLVSLATVSTSSALAPKLIYNANVGEFGDPRLLRDLAVLAEESGWDGVYLWDHTLFHEPEWPVANPTVTSVGIRTPSHRMLRSRR